MNDKERLIEAMNLVADGRMSPMEEGYFEDAEIAAAFDHMVHGIAERSNHYLARINDAQGRIGDTSCLKEMFQKIAQQQGMLEGIQGIKETLEPDDGSLAEYNEEFEIAAQQLRMAFGPTLGDIIAAEQILIDSVEIMKESNTELSERCREIVEELTQLLHQCKLRLQSVERRVDTVAKNSHKLFGTFDNKASANSKLLECLDRLETGYRELSADCLETGRHLYRISRDIDNARNDMYRNNSKPTLHDELHVFEVDHLTLTWRLFNNIVEFESLKLSQVNNPDGCKLGKWIASVSDERISQSEELAEVKKEHEELHRVLVECFEAKQNYDALHAMKAFETALSQYYHFYEAMTHLHEKLRELGYTQETDLWIFRG